MNDLFDKEIKSGSFDQNDFQFYRQMIDEQHASVTVIKRKVFLVTALILTINVAACITAFKIEQVKYWGMLISFIGSVCVLFYALAKIAKTIKSVKDAFPNERFVWINVVNLICFVILLIFTYCSYLFADGIQDD